MMLKNVKHEKFCQLISAGMLQHDAYWGAGFTKGKIEPAKANACRLLERADVRDRLTVIRNELAESTNIDKKDILKLLKGMLYSKTDTTKDIQKAIEIVNKMLGFNEPDSINVKHAGVIHYPAKKDITDNPTILNG